MRGGGEQQKAMTRTEGQKTEREGRPGESGWEGTGGQSGRAAGTRDVESRRTEEV